MATSKLSKELEQAFNDQITAEASASQTYLAMASWADVQGLPNVAAFFFGHAAEERMHMLKILKYVNERDGLAKVEALPAPTSEYKGMADILNAFHKHEVHVTDLICNLTDIALKDKDFVSYEFLRWYLDEQREEEALAKEAIDKYELVKNDPSALALIDDFLGTLATPDEEAASAEG